MKYFIAVPPKLSRFSFREDLALGDRASAQCTVNRGDMPLKAIWQKDNIPIHSLMGVTVRELDAFTTVLTIEHLGPEHAGNYSCIVSNDAATVHHTATLHVNGNFWLFVFSFVVGCLGFTLFFHLSLLLVLVPAWINSGMCIWLCSHLVGPPCCYMGF